MKLSTFLPIVVLCFSFVALADTPPDLAAPKPENPRLLRILLHVSGSARLIDYPDVERLLCCEKDRVVFETQDGTVVMHVGSFTILEPRNAATRTSAGSGPRFFDIK